LPRVQVERAAAHRFQLCKGVTTEDEKRVVDLELGIGLPMSSAAQRRCTLATT
jgi:hypothetical protein